MPIYRFPDPHQTTEDGVVAVGGDLSVTTLLLAYSKGIFPWPMEEVPLLWFCPPQRAILEWNQIHIPRSLSRFIRKSPFQFTLDQAFGEVISHCARVPRPGQEGTWITPAIREAYIELHKQGHAHSVEVWQGKSLVGGVYGVDAGGAFAGESMFHLVPNASKLAILFLMEHLHHRGLDWLDIQVLTPHLQALGARMIARDEFLERLAQTRANRKSLF